MLLLNGTLPLRYCAARFAYSTPTWRLPSSGHVDRLVAAHSDAAGNHGDEVLGLRVHRVSGFGPVRKQKTSCTPRRVIDSFSSTCLEETASCLVFQKFQCLITLGGVVIMLMGEQLLHMTGLGWSNSPGNCAGPPLQVSCLR